MNAKKKGNAGENNFANWLRENNICNGYRNSSSGSNIVKSDVNNDLGINFEVKTVKKLNLQEAYKQSKRDAEMSHSIPYVVIHFDGMPKDTWLMVMNNWDWADLMRKEDSQTTPVKQNNNKLKWLLKSGIEILKKIIKELENL